MKNLVVPSLLFVVTLLTGCQTPVPRTGDAAANVTVEFQNPENFRDVRESLGGITDENALAALRAHLQEKAGERLQPGQKLRVVFKDIDLAGDFPGTGGGRYDRVRVIRGVYIPRQEIHFELTDAAGQVIKSGERTLTDLNFQAAGLRIGSDQPYFYDKVLLEDWLRKEFR